MSIHLSYKLELAVKSFAPRCGVTEDLRNQVSVFFLERRAEIFAYLLTLGIRPAEAQEITQEAFLKYYAARCDRQSISNPRAWVYTVAHNLAMNLHARPDETALPMDLPTLEKDNPETLVLSQERMQRLHQALENLSPQQRSCLHLRAEGFRYREIASIIGINSSTVGEFLQRAIKRLRKALHE